MCQGLRKILYGHMFPLPLKLLSCVSRIPGLRGQDCSIPPAANCVIKERLSDIAMLFSTMKNHIRELKHSIPLEGTYLKAKHV